MLEHKNLLVLVYIGDKENILSIFDCIKNYYKVENFSLAFCINYELLHETTRLVQSYFNTNYIIYSSHELGNDITPSLLVYDEIIQRFNFDYIIKIHTKRDLNFLQKSMNFLLKSNIKTHLKKQNNRSFSIGFKYIRNITDKFNTRLNFKFKHLLIKNEFVPGAIFLTKKNTMDNVLAFFKTNYKILFLQNMYDNNSLNSDYSYVHFLERLFGYM